MDINIGKSFPFLLIIGFMLIELACFAQLPVKVSDPRLEIEGHILSISYDILNSNPEERFDILIEVRDEDGQNIEASALEGDIGKAVQGGNNKHITWNLEIDSIFIDSRIFVTVYADPIQPSAPIQSPAPVVAHTKEEPQESSLEKEDRREPSPDQAIKEEEASKRYSRTGIIMQSLAFPGVGLARLTGNPHWIRGVAGYGCIAASVIYNRKAIATYEDYRYTTPGTDKEAFYTQSASQDNISEVLAYTAIGIWVMDFVWTVAGSSSLKRQPFYSDAGDLTIRAGVDQQSRIPLIGIRYRF